MDRTDYVGQIELLDPSGLLIGSMEAFGELKPGAHLTVKPSRSIRAGFAYLARLRTPENLHYFRFRDRWTWIEKDSTLTCSEGMEVSE